jgi:hypothetical protein
VEVVAEPAAQHQVQAVLVVAETAPGAIRLRLELTGLVVAGAVADSPRLVLVAEAEYVL